MNNNQKSTLKYYVHEYNGSGRQVAGPFPDPVSAGQARDNAAKRTGRRHVVIGQGV